ncbi:S66 peptidase family protein [Glycomyces salinus]|uniref:S66 peptidase family protein n=1 Tax=Glycomyces salinus TaxID=980294 RepID=UPI0027DA91A9|nr:LD-carboxypeptidase [Glycomyces salinus]
MTPLERPPRLRPGDRVAVVAPSGPMPPRELERGVAVLREWGLEPVVMPHVLDGHPGLRYLAASDADRAADFERAWSDDSLAGIVAARGGYGAQRMLDLVDWNRLAGGEPKVVVGFSDATALQEAVALRLGVASLHGPMPALAHFLDHPESQEHLRLTLFEPESVQKLAPSGARTMVPGRAEGVTFGGTLSLLASGVGTAEHRPRADGGILLLEEIDEADYRIDRFLTQMRRSGWLDGVAGIVLGSWTESGPYERVRSVLLDRLGDLGAPIVEEFGFGHCAPSLTVPLGVPARLDADAGTLDFVVPALR